MFLLPELQVLLVRSRPRTDRRWSSGARPLSLMRRLSPCRGEPAYIMVRSKISVSQRRIAADGVIHTAYPRFLNYGPPSDRRH